MTDDSIFQSRKVFYTSLGCKLNFAEMSSLGRQLSEVGFSTVKAGQVPDVCVVNTCSVTDTADKKSRQAISRLVRKYPNAYIIVTGCYAQLKPSEIANLPGVDLVLGANEKFDVLDYLEGKKQAPENRLATSRTAAIETFQPAFSKDDRTRYFLKVQDGCDYYCSYCTIPYARGKSRNGSIALLVSQAKQIANEGGLEIVLSGVNIGDFGKTTKETFLDLLKALDKVEGIKRFRISSVEPNLLSEAVIDFVAKSERFMPHFHIPLQSGSDTLLQLMKRRYDCALFASRINHIRLLMPHAFIGVDVIVGSRGETPELFEETYSFLDALDVTQLHVFSYSERPGTKALTITPIVTAAEKKVRHERLQALSDKKWKAFYLQHCGETEQVLFEHTAKEGHMSGFTSNYIRVEAPVRREWMNCLIPVRLGGFTTDGSALTAEPLINNKD